MNASFNESWPPRSTVPGVSAATNASNAGACRRAGSAKVRANRANSGASSANTFRLPAAIWSLTSLTTARATSKTSTFSFSQPSNGNGLVSAASNGSSAASSRSACATSAGTSSPRIDCPAVFDAQVANDDQFALPFPITAAIAAASS